MKLAKKRVHWKEKDVITGEVHDEDVDVYTSADAVTFDDGETLQQKHDNDEKNYVTNDKFIEHVLDKVNPHNVTPEQIGAYTKKEIDSRLWNKETVVSPNTGFAEIAEWADGNPDNENRLGYFVSVDISDAGIIMTKATSTSDIRGVTISNPAFAANAGSDKFIDEDENDRLFPKYNYVAFVGFAEVYDYGRCDIKGRCISDDNGTAIPSTNSMGYQVIERINNDKILILVEPGADTFNKMKTDIDKISTEGGLVIEGNNVFKFGKDTKGIFLELIAKNSN